MVATATGTPCCTVARSRPQPDGRWGQGYGRIVHAQSIDLNNMLQTNNLTCEQLVDLAIMIGTDYHPGIKGIGPKTGLKLITARHPRPCEAKEKEVPERLEEIREIFLNHPAVEVDDNDLKQGQAIEDRAGPG